MVSARPGSRLPGVKVVELVPGLFVANVDRLKSTTAGAFELVDPSNDAAASSSFSTTFAAALTPTTVFAVAAVSATLRKLQSNWLNAMAYSPSVPKICDPKRRLNMFQQPTL